MTKVCRALYYPNFKQSFDAARNEGTSRWGTACLPGTRQGRFARKVPRSDFLGVAPRNAVICCATGSKTGRNGMKYSLSEAAKATGKNKTTIQRAIKNGKVSALKGNSGSYEIDPSELHRVFPPATAQPDAQHPQGNDTQQAKSTPINRDLTRVLELEKELAVARERASGLEAQKDQMADTISDLRKRLDSSESRVTALLADDRPKRRFLSRLFGQ